MSTFYASLDATERVKHGDIHDLEAVAVYDAGEAGFFPWEEREPLPLGWFDNYRNALAELDRLFPGDRPCGEFEMREGPRA